MMLATDRAWVSPGQWGSAAFFGFLLACLGGLVIHRAARSDVTYAFLTSYLAILFGRAMWLGLPFTIPLHQLQNGAFLLFTAQPLLGRRLLPSYGGGFVVWTSCLVFFQAVVLAGYAYAHALRLRSGRWHLLLAALAALAAPISEPGEVPTT